jgi:hypothetical protein
MGPLVPLIAANIQEHLIMKFQESVAGTVAGNQGEAPQQGAPTEAIVAQAAQKVADQNRRIMELEQTAPDTARAKLADAEMQRVINETTQLENEIEDKVYERNKEALEMSFNKYKLELQEQNKLMIAELQAQNEQYKLKLKEMNDLMKSASQIVATADLEGKRLKSAEKKNWFGGTKKEKPTTTPPPTE